nr:photosynthetic NDH subunit of subcomplex B 4, chloroplastic isoform X3 [Solanum lycopersicum]
MSFTFIKPSIPSPTSELLHPFSKSRLRHCPTSPFGNNAGRRHQIERNRVKALPDWPLMAVLVEHMEGQRDLITHKSVWHLSDEAMKNIHFTSCSLFGDAVSSVLPKILTMIQNNTEEMEVMVLDIGSMRSKKTSKKKREQSCGVMN